MKTAGHPRCLDVEAAVQEVFIGQLLLSQPHTRVPARVDPAERSALEPPMHQIAK